jgi:hypothetical protein
MVTTWSFVLILSKYRDHSIYSVEGRNAPHNEKGECETMNDNCDGMTAEKWMKIKGEGAVWRITLSMATAFGWLAFLILWLGFYAGEYNAYQNIAVIIGSVIGLVAINALVWVTFGLRMAKEEGGWYPHGSSVVTALAGIAWVVFLVVWLMLYAGDYSIYQNIAVFLVSVLALGGTSAIAHTIDWARHHGH